MTDALRAMVPELAKMLVGHVWCSVPGASLYLVSEDGEVVSMVRRKPRRLKPIFCGAYLAVQMRMDDGSMAKRYIHRLVLETTYGPAPEGTEGRHLDGDRFNNSHNNLAWGTCRENARDRVAHGTSGHGERNPQAKLTRYAVAEMRRLYANGGWTFKGLASAFGVSAMTAHRAVRGKSWN